ncbi:MAG: hypothetical protein ABI847_03200 [Anaerolineales bacterium]
MNPKPQFAPQPIRRKFSIPFWAWSLALLASMALAFSAAHAAQASAGSPQARAGAAGDDRRDPDAPNIYKWVRTATSAWDVPAGAALTNPGQTQHLATYVQQLTGTQGARPATRRAIKFGQAEHPEHVEVGYPGLPTTISEREQVLRDGRN